MAGIDNNTVVYLRGDSFKDLSLNSKTISYNGIVVTKDDIINNCYLVNGSGNYVSFSDLKLTSDFTIECMVNLGSYANGFGFPIITPYDHALVPGQPFVSIVSSNNGGYISKRVVFSNHGNTSPKIQSSMDVTLNDWHHIALVRKGNVISLYLNGVGQGEVSYSNNFSIKNSVFGSVLNGEYGINTKVYNYRISNVARYTEDFTPPTKAYNSININITNQTKDKIDFNVSKLGLETINKIEVLVNGIVSKTYDNIGDLTYNIDKSLLLNGNNKIKIKVTFDDNYTEEKEFNYEYKIDSLPTASSLKDVIDRQELLTNVIEVQKNNLKSILESKNVVVSEEENKMSILIQKVNELSSVAFVKELQDNQVQFLNEITLLEEENENLKQELTLIKNALNETLLIKMEV